MLELAVCEVDETIALKDMNMVETSFTMYFVCYSACCCIHFVLVPLDFIYIVSDITK